MNIRVNRKSYTTLSNYPITDRNLSALSLGIFCYIMSKPDGWNAHKKEILKRFSEASIDTKKNAIDNAFKELVASGYVEIKAIKVKSENGKYIFKGKEYVFNEEPVNKFENLPKTEDIGTSEISDFGNIGESEILPYKVSTDFKINTEEDLQTTDLKEKKEISVSEYEIESVKYYFETNQILELLTEKTGAKYKIPKTKSLLLRYGVYKLIKERFEDGAILEDFVNIIEYKYNEWINTKFISYLVPDTLFRKSNFEKYLTQIQIKPISNNTNNLIDDNGNYAKTDEGRKLFHANVAKGAADAIRAIRNGERDDFWLRISNAKPE